MRVTVIAKGDLENFILREMEKTGLSAGMTCLNLALSGMKYEDGLKSMSVLAAALDNQMRKGI